MVMILQEVWIWQDLHYKSFTQMSWTDLIFTFRQTKYLEFFYEFSMAVSSLFDMIPGQFHQTRSKYSVSTSKELSHGTNQTILDVSV